MASTDQFDILLQFQQTVMQDLQHRMLNASPFTTLWVKSPLTRRIEQPVPPLEVKACWNKPNVTISDGSVELAAELNGGARQVLSGRILTLDGTVSARQTVTSAVDASQRPYVCVKEPNPVQLNIRQLKISYEGSRWPALLNKLNPAKEATALRPVLATELFGPLAGIPLTCMPYSLPVSMPDKKGGVAAGMLPIKRVVPGLFVTPASVALGLILDDKRAAPAVSAGILPPQSRYNAAIALSEHGLNALLSHVCEQGEATGKFCHSRFSEIEWRWEKLNVKLRQNVLAISGLLVQQGVKCSVVAEVKSMLVNNGCLSSQIISSNADANLVETLLASWNGLLTILLRSRAANKRDRDARDAERMFQCFDLPTSKLTVETMALELLVTDEQFIVYYTISKSGKEFQIELPPLKPAVIITQPHIPQQTTPGAPVTIELDVQVTRNSTPPYDYAWTNDLSPHPIPQFGSRFTVSSVPVKPAVGAGPQTLTTAHLKVIDMFGQVAEAQAPAQYLPPTKHRQQQPKKSAGGVWVVMAIVIAVGIYAVAHAAAGSGIGIPGSQQTPGSQQSGQQFNFSFSGAVNGTLAVGTVKYCGVSADNSEYHVLLDGTVNGSGYTLEIISTPYTGPGIYNSASNTYTVMAPATFDQDWSSVTTWPFQSGSVVVNNDAQSGSISATLLDANNNNTPVQVSGTWRCV